MTPALTPGARVRGPYGPGVIESVGADRDAGTAVVRFFADQREQWCARRVLLAVLTPVLSLRLEIVK